MELTPSDSSAHSFKSLQIDALLFQRPHTHRTRSSIITSIDLHFLRLKTGPLLSIRGYLFGFNDHDHVSRLLQNYSTEGTQRLKSTQRVTSQTNSTTLFHAAVSFHTKTNQFCTFRLFRITLIHLTCCLVFGGCLAFQRLFSTLRFFLLHGRLDTLHIRHNGPRGIRAFTLHIHLSGPNDSMSQVFFDNEMLPPRIITRCTRKCP